VNVRLLNVRALLERERRRKRAAEDLLACARAQAVERESHYLELEAELHSRAVSWLEEIEAKEMS
jgi:hypothetical protein